jgi:hypothetical protein
VLHNNNISSSSSSSSFLSLFYIALVAVVVKETFKSSSVFVFALFVGRPVCLID